MIKRIAKTLTHMSLAIFTIGFIAVWNYMVWRPYNIVTVNEPDGGFVAVTPQVQVGESVGYEIDICVHESYPAVIKRRLDNGKTHALGAIYPPQPKIGCIKEVVYSEIDKPVPAGHYDMIIEVEHKVNPLRTVSYSWQVVGIEVVE